MDNKDVDVDPIFIKIYDFNRKNDIGESFGYELCQAVARVIGNTNVDGVQQVRSLYRIYVKSKEARVKLLVRTSVAVLGKVIPLYDSNPYLTGSTKFNQHREKVTLKDIPMAVSNDDVMKSLKNLGIEIIGSIKWGKKQE